MRALRIAVLALGLAGPLASAACGGTGGVPPEGMTRTAATAQRVFDILKRRHAGGEPATAPASARAFEAVLRALDPRDGCRAQREALRARSSDLFAQLRAGDADFVRDAALRCNGRALSAAAAETIALDALAKAFDAHSAFLPAGQLAAFRDAIYETLPEAQQARGLVALHAGERVGLIVLPSFYLQAGGRSATRDVLFIAEQLTREGASLLLLDLRGNRGGVIAEAVQLLSALGCSGSLGQERARQAVRELRAQPTASRYTGPLAVAVDADTAGVSELFAAAVQDQRRGVVVGARTRGHGSAQTLVLLRSPKGTPEGGVRVTDRYFLRAHGEPIEGRGVVPDAAVAGTATAEAADADAIIERAIESLRAAPAATRAGRIR